MEISVLYVQTAYSLFFSKTSSLHFSIFIHLYRPGSFLSTLPLQSSIMCCTVYLMDAQKSYLFLWFGDFLFFDFLRVFPRPERLRCLGSLCVYTSFRSVSWGSGGHEKVGNPGLYSYKIRRNIVPIVTMLWTKAAIHQNIMISKKLVEYCVNFMIDSLW